MNSFLLIIVLVGLASIYEAQSQVQPCPPVITGSLDNVYYVSGVSLPIQDIGQPANGVVGSFGTYTITPGLTSAQVSLSIAPLPGGAPANIPFVALWASDSNSSAPLQQAPLQEFLDFSSPDVQFFVSPTSYQFEIPYPEPVTTCPSTVNLQLDVYTTRTISTVVDDVLFGAPVPLTIQFCCSGSPTPSPVPTPNPPSPTPPTTNPPPPTTNPPPPTPAPSPVPGPMQPFPPRGPHKYRPPQPVPPPYNHAPPQGGSWQQNGDDNEYDDGDQNIDYQGPPVRYQPRGPYRYRIRYPPPPPPPRQYYRPSWQPPRIYVHSRYNNNGGGGSYYDGGDDDYQPSYYDDDILGGFYDR